MLAHDTLAEFAGDKTPLGMQRLLNQAVWDEGQVWDRLVRYVAAELGDPGGPRRTVSPWP